MRTSFQLVTALVAAASTTGCSLVLTHGPHADPPALAPGAPVPMQAMAPDCTTSMSWPTVDAIISGIAVLGAISASDNSANRDGTTSSNNNDAVAPLLIIGVTAAVSGIIGYQRVNKCRKATEAYAAQYTYPQAGTAGYPYAQQQPYGYQYPQPYQQPYPQQPYVGPTPPPGQQPSVQSTPAPPPPVQPVVRPTPPPAPPAPKPAPKPPTPAPAPKPAELGTEGDVCTSQSECATGYACTNNVCLRKK